MELIETITVLTDEIALDGAYARCRRIHRYQMGPSHRHRHADRRMEPISGIQPDGMGVLGASLISTGHARHTQVRSHINPHLVKEA